MNSSAFTRTLLLWMVAVMLATWHGTSVAASPSSNPAGDTQALLLDLNGTSYDWGQTAPHYGAIALNAWNSSWIAAIRAANPSVKVFVYKDLTSSRTSACQNGVDQAELPTGVGYCWAMANHPEWFLHNASGGLLVENGYPTQYEMDYGNAAYQQQWATNVVQDVTSHGWDGVEMDNAFTTYNAYGVSPTYPNDQATQTAMQSMLATIGPQIKTAAKLEVANVGYDTKYPSIWAAWLPLLTGLMDEYTWSWSTSVDQSVPDWNIFENEVSACAAAHDLCWFRVGAYQQQSAALVNFAVASYLLQADGASVLGPGDMLWSNYPELYTSLDAALGTAYINGNGNWQRDFQGGSVIVNLSTWTGTVVPRAFAWVAHDNTTAPQPFWGTSAGGCPCSYAWGSSASNNLAFSRRTSPNFGQVVGTGAALVGTLGPTVAAGQALTNATVSAWGGTQWGALLRWTDSTHWYEAHLDGTNLVIQKDAGGSPSVLASVPFTATVGTNYTLRFQAIGTSLAAKAWQSGQSEPDWLAQAIDPSLSSGSGGLRTLAPTGTTVTYTTFTVLA